MVSPCTPSWHLPNGRRHTSQAVLSRIGSNLLRSYETSIENQRIGNRDSCSIGRHLGDMRWRYSMLRSAKVQSNMSGSSPDMDVSVFGLIIEHLGRRRCTINVQNGGIELSLLLSEWFCGLILNDMLSSPCAPIAMLGLCVLVGALYFVVFDKKSFGRRATAWLQMLRSITPTVAQNKHLSYHRLAIPSASSVAVRRTPLHAGIGIWYRSDEKQTLRY